MGFENVAFSDKATCSQRKVIIICLNSCVNTSGHALPHSTVIASCLLRISKLDPDLHSRFVLPCKEFELETSKAQNSSVRKDTKNCNFLKYHSVGYIPKIMESL